MPKHSSIKKDENQLAYAIMSEAVDSGKNPAAVALGHLGGLKGGRARAIKLSAKKRREIAKKAAESRWGKY